MAPPPDFLSHDSAKQVPRSKSPLLQATEITKGSLLPLESPATLAELKPVVPHPSPHPRPYGMGQSSTALVASNAERWSTFLNLKCCIDASSLVNRMPESL